MMSALPSNDISFRAELRVGPEPATPPSPLPMVGAIAGVLTTLAIVLFDLTAGLGASGIGVGAWPVASAFAIAPCYVALVSVLHRRASPPQRLWTLLAFSFGLLYAGVVSLNYALQLTVVPQNPEAFAGWTMQLKPDSAFWALEIAGYSYMGLSAAFLIPALRAARSERIAGWLLAINGVGTVIGLIGYMTTRDPGNWLAVGSLLVWGITVPIATGVIAWRLWGERAPGRA